MKTIQQNSLFDQELLEKAEQQISEQSKKIEFYIVEYTIEILALKMDNSDFEVPTYQREFTWEDERKSKFIESVIMGLPIPFLFFWENPSSGRLEIVDGSQRLRTIKDFLLGDFKLGDLSELSLLAGFKFNDLSESRQRKIKNRSIRGIVLNEHTEEQSRFDLFERINTGSKIANPAEVRRGALGGTFFELVEQLAKNEKFIEMTPVSEKRVNEREREELVTRFFAYGDGLDKYKDKVSEFLYHYTKKMNEEFSNNPSKKAEYESRFTRMIDFVDKKFDFGFKKTKQAQSTPRSRYEAIAIGSYLAMLEDEHIVDKNIDTSWATGEEFIEITGSDGANVIKRLKGRINFVKEKLLNR